MFAISSDWPKRLKRLIIESLKAWVAQRASSKGAAVAFYTLFSLAPILLLAIGIAGLVFGKKAAHGQIMGQIQGIIGPRGAEAVQSLLAHGHNSGSGLAATVIAGAVLLIGATTIFAELKESLDEIWGVHNEHRSGLMSLLRTRLLAFGLVLSLAALLLLSLLLSAAVGVLERYGSAVWSSSGAALGAFSSFISFAVIACLFAVVYKALPDAKPGWRDVWIGAVVTAVLFTAGKYAIGFYLGTSAITSGYGAAGSLIALLLWVYYSAQIFFLGAEFTHQYALQFGTQCPETRPATQPADSDSAAG
ncbi:MAG TPA: YihY/virulence factor BrkB family protein [Burkholderiales bacterium]|nr:YihY/virulence factor BrkB family protein [Burkholderiales bacterium]